MATVAAEAPDSVTVRLLVGVTAHLTAGMTVILACAGAGALLYFALLGLALLTAQPLGGPLGVIAMAGLGYLTGSLLGFLVACPSSIAARFLCPRLGWPWAAEVPISSGISILLCVVWTNAASVFWSWRFPTALVITATLVPLSLITLGIYWWTLRSVSAFGTVGTRLVARACHRVRGSRDHARSAGAGLSRNS